MSLFKLYIKKEYFMIEKRVNIVANYVYAITILLILCLCFRACF